MEEISFRIIGIDQKRPPRIRKEPYIDLFFELSEQPPEEWCDNFNRLSKKLVPPAKIDVKKGLFIESYVRDMQHIADYLDEIKKHVASCNEQLNESIRLKVLADSEGNSAILGEEGEQGKLNKIIAALQFED